MKATKLELKPWAWHGGIPTNWGLVAHVDIPKLPRLTNYTMFDTSARAVQGRKTQFFFAEQDGYVSYQLQTDDTHGYGGSTFNKFVKNAYVLKEDNTLSYEEHITGVRDPAIEYAQNLVGWWVLKGPWSSRASVMNDLTLQYEFLGWPLCMEVTFVTSDGLRWAGAATIGWVYEQIQRLARLTIEVVHQPTGGSTPEHAWVVRPTIYSEEEE